ncbi:MAG: hypothetical protein ACFFD1_05450 [Candidatus Thorarchaeota archaeon]
MNSNSYKIFSIKFLVIITLLMVPSFIPGDTGLGTSNNLRLLQTVPSPAFNNTEVTYSLFFGNDPAVSYNQYSLLFNKLQENFGTYSNITDLSQASDSRIYSIFSPQTNITTDLSTLRTEILDRGKGLLYIVQGDNPNATKTANRFFSDFFQDNLIEINSTLVTSETISSTLNYTQVTNFVSPASPIFTNVTKLYYNGTYLDVNQTKIDSYSSLNTSIARIKDSYPLMIDNSHGNTLAYTFEFVGKASNANKGRIVILMSTDALMNNALNAIPGSVPISGIQNSQFGVNLFRWLGRASGYVRLIDSSINAKNGTTIYPNQNLNITFTLNDDNGQPFKNGIVRLSVQAAETEYYAFYAKPVGNGTFTASFSPETVPLLRSYTIDIVISKRGYLEQNILLITHLYLNVYPTVWYLPNLMQIITITGGTMIFVISTFFLYNKYRKIE